MCMCVGGGGGGEKKTSKKQTTFFLPQREMKQNKIDREHLFKTTSRGFITF